MSQVSQMFLWDRFLDAYSAYLKERTLQTAEELWLCGQELECLSGDFSWDHFVETWLGWKMDMAPSRCGC